MLLSGRRAGEGRSKLRVRALARAPGCAQNVRKLGGSWVLLDQLPEEEGCLGSRPPAACCRLCCRREPDHHPKEAGRKWTFISPSQTGSLCKPLRGTTFLASPTGKNWFIKQDFLYFKSRYSLRTRELVTQSRAEVGLGRLQQKALMPDQPSLCRRTKAPCPLSTTALISVLHLIHWRASRPSTAAPPSSSSFFVPCAPSSG
ncbi:uncharacterized protein [Vicugna pacos]|uniref:Uncharacterized protein isoform X2 n=1 Tax=Vicugna pacos TaxID=30538 RepID=A0ABM5CMX8_VICPA